MALKRAIRKDQGQPTYIYLSEEDFEKLQSSDLNLVTMETISGRPLKSYIGANPDDWDLDEPVSS